MMVPSGSVMGGGAGVTGAGGVEIAPTGAVEAAPAGMVVVETTVGGACFEEHPTSSRIGRIPGSLNLCMFYTFGWIDWVIGRFATLLYICR
jgi:hypothetical protein